MSYTAHDDKYFNGRNYTGSIRFVESADNSIDSTIGDWEIVGGESNLYVINHKNSKKYKINLTEVS
jgi:hypothetical protein